MPAASLLPELPHGARILVIRLRSIGDIILLTPALRLLKGWRPDLRISAIVESRFRELLEGNPDVEEILSPGDNRGAVQLFSKLQIARELRRRKFTLCMNLHGGPTSRFLTRASGATHKVGFAHYRGRGLYSVLVPDAREILNQPAIHTAEHQASALFYLGLPRVPIPRARLFVTAEHRKWWEEKRRGLEILSGQEYAIIHPTALYPTKQWAPEKFARLGKYLETEKRLAIVYSRGPGEEAVLDAVQQAAGSPIRRLEGATLGQFTASLAETRLFVGNDSGPAHMAAALERPLAVVFGSSSSVIWGPWPRPSVGGPAHVVQNPYDCNPCPGDRCYRFDRPECILSVTFEQVQEAVDAVMASPLPRPGGS